MESSYYPTMHPYLFYLLDKVITFIYQWTQNLWSLCVNRAPQRKARSFIYRKLFSRRLFRIQDCLEQKTEKIVKIWAFIGSAPRADPTVLETTRGSLSLSLTHPPPRGRRPRYIMPVYTPYFHTHFLGTICPILVR